MSLCRHSSLAVLALVSLMSAGCASSGPVVSTPEEAEAVAQAKAERQTKATRAQTMSRNAQTLAASAADKRDAAAALQVEAVHAVRRAEKLRAAALVLEADAAVNVLAGHSFMDMYDTDRSTSVAEQAADKRATAAAHREEARRLRADAQAMRQKKSVLLAEAKDDEEAARVAASGAQMLRTQLASGN
jgi:hypothetical protein